MTTPPMLTIWSLPIGRCAGGSDWVPPPPEMCHGLENQNIVILKYEICTISYGNIVLPI